MSLHFSDLPQSLAILAFPLDLATGLRSNDLQLEHCHLALI